MARACSQTTIHPIDTIKVRMQAGPRPAPAEGGRAGGEGTHAPHAADTCARTQAVARCCMGLARLPWQHVCSSRQTWVCARRGQHAHPGMQARTAGPERCTHTPQARREAGRAGAPSARGSSIGARMGLTQSSPITSTLPCRGTLHLRRGIARHQDQCSRRAHEGGRRPGAAAGAVWRAGAEPVQGAWRALGERALYLVHAATRLPHQEQAVHPPMGCGGVTATG